MTRRTLAATRRYRCYYNPLTIDGYVIPSESGVLPYVDVDADDAEQAQRRAFESKKAPIALVERLEDSAPARAKRAPRQPQVAIQLMTGATMLAALLAGGGSTGSAT